MEYAPEGAWRPSPFRGILGRLYAPRMSDWRDPGFLDDARAWIEEQLARLGLRRDGEIEQPHVYPWSTVLRVPVEGGSVWFKANAPELVHEAALVGHLSARRPDAVPPLLAADERGWMLMADAGESLRAVVERERDLGRWLDVLPLYAGVQLDLEPDVDELLALGVPDLRLAALPELFARRLDEIGAERRFHDALSRVCELCDELAAFGIPETIQHDDLHDGQVFVRDGPPPAARLGRRVRLPPVLHPRRHPRRRARVGPGRCRALARHGPVPRRVPSAVCGPLR